MERKFEAHITCNRADADKLRALLVRLAGWKYSSFDADPVMGDKPFAYLTAYDTDPYVLRGRTLMAAGLLSAQGIEVLRQKVEEIVYDTKTGHNTLKL